MTTSSSLAQRLPKLVAACATLLEASHASVDARVAACATLAGAQGKRAFVALVAALDDGSALVRRAAVVALVASCTGPHAPRLAHAAWHKRSDVRRLTLELATLPASLWPPLLADPVLADEAHATLRDRASREPGAFAVVVTRHRAQSAADLAAVLATLPWSSPTAFLRVVPHRRSTTSRGAATGGDDHLIDVFAVVADHADLVDIVSAGLVVAMRRRLLDSDDLRRISDALVVVGAMRGTLPARLLAVAIDGDLGVVDNDALPLDDRRGACRALVTHGVARHDDVFGRASVVGGDDVDVLAGLMRLCSEAPYRQLTTSIAAASLAPIVWRRRCAALLTLAPTNAADRDAATALTTAVAEAAATDDELDLVALAGFAVVAADPVALLAPFLDLPGVAASLLGTIVASDELHVVDDLDEAHAERRLERVVELLARHVDVPVLAGVVRIAAQQLAHDERSARVATVAVVLDAIVRTVSSSTLCSVVDGLAARERSSFMSWLLPRLPASFGDDIDSTQHADGLAAVVAHHRVARRRRTLRDDEMNAIEAATDDDVARVVATLLRDGRRTGVVAALRRRPSTPASPALAAAVLSSADPIVDVAAFVVALGVIDRVAIRAALHGTPPTLLAAAFAAADDNDDDDDDVLRREAIDGPGGLLGALDLALALPEPVAVVVVAALHRCRRDDDFRANRIGRVVDRLDVALATAHGPWRDALTLWRKTLAPATPPTPSPIELASAALVAGRHDAVLELDVDTRAELVRGAIVAGVKGLAAVARSLPRAYRDTIAVDALDNADDAERAEWLQLLPSSSSPRLDVLRDLAAWASRQSLLLVGRPLGLTWIGDALGYTRLTSTRIHINPLPVLLDERDGDDIVRGLIAHELGHHRHHASPAALTIWQRAEREGLTRLLNLVADEHLERNLRALSSTHGHRLQLLAAWAFQHRKKALPVDDVLVAVGHHPAALIGASLAVAGVAGQIVVDVGSLLGDLERRGSSFSRFMRALRMGKGNRHHDPLVARGLALFAGADFKAAEMPRLLEIARQLRTIFGDDVKQLGATDFHRLADASDDDLATSGIHPDDLDAVGAAPTSRTAPAPARRTRNTGDDIAFDVIDNVVHVDADVVATRALLRDARRPAARLRAVLASFGEATHVEHRRLQGQRLDRAALDALVLHNDPRVLRRRHRVRIADVFVGVAIDCSGSMRGDGLVRAQRIAAVIAAACKGLVDVDARFVGFNDTTLFDAGDARRFGAAGLVADGGNNDAAAVAWLTRLARRSSRSMKLIVMISDGAPTECSVAAVRHVVDVASRQGIVCVQAAVAPIDDPCFADHVLIDDDDDAAAVRRFATMIERRLTGAARRRRASDATTTYTQAVEDE